MWQANTVGEVGISEYTHTVPYDFLGAFVRHQDYIQLVPYLPLGVFRQDRKSHLTGNLCARKQVGFLLIQIDFGEIIVPNDKEAEV